MQSTIATRWARLKKPRWQTKKVEKAELEEIINRLPIEEWQKLALKARWLHQVLYWNKRADESKWKYHTLRSITAIFGAIIPALVSLNLTAEPTFVGRGLTQWITILLGVAVAGSVAIEEIFHFGDIWREKRNAVELLLIEGWKFFQLNGPYKGKKHKEAYPDFAARVEDIIEKEIQRYLTVFWAKGKEEEEEPLITQQTTP